MDVSWPQNHKAFRKIERLVNESFSYRWVEQDEAQNGDQRQADDPHDLKESQSFQNPHITQEQIQFLSYRDFIAKVNCLCISQLTMNM